MRTVDEFVTKIQEVADFATAGELQRFLAQALQDPDIAAFVAVRHRATRTKPGKMPVTLRDFVAESFGAINAPNLSPSAVTGALVGNLSEIEGFRDRLLWIARGRIADGPCIDLKAAKFAPNTMLPAALREPIFLRRGFHAHKCTKNCKQNCKNVGQVHFGSEWRGIPHTGSEMMAGSQLIRPDDPRAAFLQERARQSAAAQTRDIRAKFAEVSGRKVTVKAQSGEFSGVVTLVQGGIEVASRENVTKLAFCDLILWEKSHRAKRATRKRRKRVQKQASLQT